MRNECHSESVGSCGPNWVTTGSKWVKHGSDMGHMGRPGHVERVKWVTWVSWVIGKVNQVKWLLGLLEFMGKYFGLLA